MGAEGKPWGGLMGITARGRRLRRLGGLCALGVLVGAAAAAPAPAAVPPSDALDRALAILAPEHANRSVPGMAGAGKHGADPDFARPCSRPRPSRAGAPL